MRDDPLNPRKFEGLPHYGPRVKTNIQENFAKKKIKENYAFHTLLILFLPLLGSVRLLILNMVP